MGKHLLVTNDFPPKVGGIQNYLYELWRRLDPSSFIVITTSHPDAEAFDSQQSFEIIRLDQKLFLPTRSLARIIRTIASDHQVDFIVWDPALPIGKLAPRVAVPYGVVVHGAELTIPARLPVTSRWLLRLLGDARFIISAGQYPKSELEQLFARSGKSLPEIIEIPPGVDPVRFEPLLVEARSEFREVLGVAHDEFLVSSVSRLVPRKGMDTLIEAAGLLSEAHPHLKVVIAGTGRDQGRLQRLITKHGAPVKLIGRVTEEQLPYLFGSSDAFAMMCRSRWAGLEQEGFGIVFLEAAACKVPVIAGFSGGSCEAVTHEETGFVVYKPRSARKVAEAISMLITDEALRKQMGENGRRRAVAEFSYDYLSEKLAKRLSVIA